MKLGNMAKENRKDSSVRGGFHVQFNLLGLVVFSASLVIAAGVLALLLMHPARSSSSRLNAAERPPDVGPSAEPDSEDVPPWGEFVTQDIQLERPEEYTAMELENVTVPTWT